MYIQEDISLASFTTFRIGGKARYFVITKTTEDLFEALEYAKEQKLKVFVLGGGSNVLFCDAGFAGLVIKIENDMREQQGTTLTVGAGATLASVVDFSLQQGLSGIELLSGIPGTFGGAIRGNAGAFGVEIGSLTETVTVFNTETMEMQTINHNEASFGYRQSFFKKNKHLIILSASIALHQGERKALFRIAEETKAKREAKHPQTLLCAGSFFMNPIVTDPLLLEEFARDTGVASRGGVLPAGWIIDYVGLRGKTIGGAQVSRIHPNYIINTGNATAEEVLILASVIRQRVRTQLNLHLQEEVQMVGF
jgi:UDP-N-acetylmuramate dehydrogenase